MRDAWLTPEQEPDCYCEVCILVPDEESCRAAFRGAIRSLAEPENWEQFGVLTPEQTAAWFVDTFESAVRMEHCVPVATILQYAGVSIPSQWLPCDGSQRSQSDYPILYATIGNNFGTADPGNFRLPDLRGRAAIGAGTGSGLSPRTLAQTGGAESVELTLPQIPQHSHAVHSHWEFLAIGPGEVPVSTPDILPAYTGDAGDDQSHDNMPPYLVLNFIIRAL